jgi:hypothetical protein
MTRPTVPSLGQPLVFADDGMTISARISDLFAQVERCAATGLDDKRDRLAMVLCYLVKATLECAMSDPAAGAIAPSEATASLQTRDLMMNDTVLHCTAAPHQLVGRCTTEVTRRLWPVIVTTANRTVLTTELTDVPELADRVGVWTIEQLVATTIAEQTHFEETRREALITDIITRYNQLVDANGTDPSLRIEFSAN